MRRLLIIIAVQLVLALISLVNEGILILDHVLEPRRSGTQFALYASCLAIVGLTVGVIFLALWNRHREIWTSWIVGAMALTVIAGFVPRLVDSLVHDKEAAARWADEQSFEKDFLTNLAAQKKDIEARIATHRAFTAEQALQFVSLVGQSDLSYRGLPNHSDTAFALLQDALRAGIIDPNDRVKGERYGELSGQPIFLYYYKVRVFGRESAQPEEWRLLRLLIDYGADLTLEEAKPLVADLAARKPADR